MQALLAITGIATLLFGVVVLSKAPSDIQVGIGASSNFSAVIMLGLGNIIGRMPR